MSFVCFVCVYLQNLTYLFIIWTFRVILVSDHDVNVDVDEQVVALVNCTFCHFFRELKIELNRYFFGFYNIYGLWCTFKKSECYRNKYTV